LYVAITPAQIRMARAALRINVRQLAKLAGVDKGTIIRIENGGNAYTATLDRLRDALEQAGVKFIPPMDDVHDGGAALKPGVKPRAGLGSSEGDGTGDGGLKALEGAEEAEAFWRANPGAWAALSQTGRYVLSREIFGAPEAGDEAFGGG
jgi:transcriptional regulator with XRE-family HTH domain